MAESAWLVIPGKTSAAWTEITRLPSATDFLNQAGPEYSFSRANPREVTISVFNLALLSSAHARRAGHPPKPQYPTERRISYEASLFATLALAALAPFVFVANYGMEAALCSESTRGQVSARFMVLA